MRYLTNIAQRVQMVISNKKRHAHCKSIPYRTKTETWPECRARAFVIENRSFLHLTPIQTTSVTVYSAFHQGLVHRRSISLHYRSKHCFRLEDREQEFPNNWGKVLRVCSFRSLRNKPKPYARFSFGTTCWADRSFSNTSLPVTPYVSMLQVRVYLVDKIRERKPDE